MEERTRKEPKKRRRSSKREKIELLEKEVEKLQTKIAKLEESNASLKKKNEDLQYDLILMDKDLKAYEEKDDSLLCHSQIDFTKQMEDNLLELANPFNQPVAAIFRRCDSEDTSEIIQTFPPSPESGHPLIKQIDNVDEIFKSYDKKNNSTRNKSTLNISDSNFFSKAKKQQQQNPPPSLPSPPSILLNDNNPFAQNNNNNNHIHQRQLSNSLYTHINTGNSFTMTSSFDHSIGSSFSAIRNNSITSNNMSFQFFPSSSFNMKDNINCLESIPSFRSVFNEDITLLELLLLNNNNIYIHINSDGIISLPEIQYNNGNNNISHLDCINNLLENEFNIPKFHLLDSVEIYHTTIQDDGKNIIFIKTIIPSSHIQKNYYKNTCNYKWITWKEFIRCKNNNIISRLVDDKHLL